MSITRCAALLILGVLSTPACSTEPLKREVPTASLDEYLENLISERPEGGGLYCETSSGGERHPYDSCESFTALREEGCYGYSMYDIHLESRYAANCATAEAISAADSSSIHYFDLDTADWWQALPASIIPLSGGIYSDESLEIARRERDKLVAGKVLGELSLSEITSEPAQFAATIELRRDECGETRNRFEMKATVLADFDNDGIAELIVEGYRVDQSDTCLLGSGNSLGAGFIVVLQKANPDGQIIVKNIAGIG